MNRWRCCRFSGLEFGSRGRPRRRCPRTSCARPRGRRRSRGVAHRRATGSGPSSPRAVAGAGRGDQQLESRAQGPEASTLGTGNVRGAAAAIRAIAFASARTHRFAVRSFGTHLRVGDTSPASSGPVSGWAGVDRGSRRRRRRHGPGWAARWPGSVRWRELPASRPATGANRGPTRARIAIPAAASTAPPPRDRNGFPSPRPDGRGRGSGAHRWDLSTYGSSPPGSIENVHSTPCPSEPSARRRFRGHRRFAQQHVRHPAHGVRVIAGGMRCAAGHVVAPSVLVARGNRGR